MSNLDNDDLKYIEQQIKLYQEDLLRQIQDDLKDLFQQAIQESIYDRYDPVEYQRSYDFLNQIGMKFVDDKLIIYNDINDMYYTSAVDDSEVTSALPWFLEHGHSDGIGNNLYHDYSGRHYLEVCKEFIESKYPDMKVQIIDDEPSMV